MPKYLEEEGKEDEEEEGNEGKEEDGKEEENEGREEVDEEHMIMQFGNQNVIPLNTGTDKFSNQ